MNITFRQLRIFLSVAELGSITAAARASNVTQPTVSMQLRELADSVGLPLYEMIGKRLCLTQAGEELAVTARAMVSEWLDFGQRMDALKGLKRGRLRIAVVSTAQYFIPRILGRFCSSHPEVDIALEVLNRGGVLQRLRANQDDLYIMSMPPGDIEIEKQVFLSNPLVVVAQASHRLAGQAGISLDSLAQERFILREQGSGTRLACDAHFAKLGFKPLVRLALGSTEALKQSVAGGLGLAVLSTHSLGEHMADDLLVTLDVAGFPIQSNWYIVQLKGKRLSPTAQAFLRHLAGSPPVSGV